VRFMVVNGRLGVLAGERFHPGPDLGRDPLLRALEDGIDLRELGQQALQSTPLGVLPASLDPPIASPSKVIAIGLNYRDHCREAGMPEPDTPVVFSKHPSSVVGAGHPIPIDKQISDEVDYEVELTVIDRDGEQHQARTQINRGS
jgi:2-keto-4-pentenoate hydratase/2-oxohepta-3-ene-1,7-dioic acid hydratase in catechol pathway